MFKEKEEENSANWQELQEIIRSIPFEGLKPEYTLMTHRMAWRSPKNMGFKISGCFFVDTDGSHQECHAYPPLPSAEVLKIWYADELPKYLSLAEGDEKAALRMLTNDDDGYLWRYNPITSFTGRWLIIHSSPDAGLPLSIEGDVEAWYEEEDYVCHLEDLVPDSSKIMSSSCLTSLPTVFWEQTTAQAAEGGCRIKLVDFPEPEMDFFIPEPAKKNPLYLPKSFEASHSRKDGYEPSIMVYTSQRPSEVDNTLIQTFDQKSDYIYWQSPFSPNEILLAKRRQERLIEAKTIRPETVTKKFTLKKQLEDGPTVF